MIHFIAKVAEIASAVGAVTGIAYNLLCIWSADRFLKPRKAEVEGLHFTQPAVSILKPLKGIDPGMYESFRSYCRQNYPEYEIIFGVSDSKDPAVEFVTSLIKEFPENKIRIVVCPKYLGANVKVGNLAQMLTEARHEYVVVNDSDIRVGPEYLRNVTAPLLDQQNGLVTCLYRGVPCKTFGSRLESLSISTDFCPGVLVARSVESGLRFGLGSTLAFRRVDLQAIGGFESLADYLADDYEVGKRLSDHGLKVVLSDEIVETYLPDYTLGSYLRHQLRWARTVRASRFWGFAGLVFTFALPWAVLSVLFSGGKYWSWVVLVLACGTRLGTLAIVGQGVLRDQNALRCFWLMPVRDILAVFLWMASFAGNTVAWRGEQFRLKHGKLLRMDRQKYT